MKGDDSRSEIEKLIAKYGTVPPPWIEFPNTHPYDICWRMGAGETYLLKWAEWWDSQQFDESKRIEYFRAWSPPPRWLGWTIDSVWNVPIPDDGDVEAARASYWLRVEAMGFGTETEYQRDLDDPKWLAS